MPSNKNRTQNRKCEEARENKKKEEGIHFRELSRQPEIRLIPMDRTRRRMKMERDKKQQKTKKKMSSYFVRDGPFPSAKGGIRKRVKIRRRREL